MCFSHLCVLISVKCFKFWDEHHLFVPIVIIIITIVLLLWKNGVKVSWSYSSVRVKVTSITVLDDVLSHRLTLKQSNGSVLETGGYDCTPVMQAGNVDEVKVKKNFKST